MTTEAILIAAFQEERECDTEKMSNEALAGQLILMTGSKEAALERAKSYHEHHPIRRTILPLSLVQDIPNPGSDAAIDLGCLCGSMDNHYGKGYMGEPGVFRINAGCPLHDQSTG